MSRITDALLRAGGARPSTPAAAVIGRADAFPAELPEERAMPATVPAPLSPMAGENSVPHDLTQDSYRWVAVQEGGQAGRFGRDVVEKLTIENGAAGAVVEEFRRLAATLHHAQGFNRLKSVLVTSAVGGEGKTLTTVNLALTLSESFRRRVLVIDADLRNPTLHRVMQVRNSVGLLTFLKNGSERSFPVVEVSPRLVFMPSGGVTPDPISMLTSEAITQLLRAASETFDWVLLDTPPAALLPDCNLLVPSVDGVLLVVDAFNTPYPMAQRAIDAVGSGKILGIVLNHARHSSSDYSYGYGSRDEKRKE